MRLFDPWPVFFKREWKRNWPFLVGFAVTGTLITKLSLGLSANVLLLLLLRQPPKLDFCSESDFPFRRGGSHKVKIRPGTQEVTLEWNICSDFAHCIRCVKRALLVINEERCCIHSMFLLPFWLFTLM
ncbi:uncharacterized protein LOC114374968 [Glycine soja]|uniref:Uncharacterized protein n=1 Tax=Glycine soja TaxID=3848 RepID=A0A445IDM5_GLYSO|nr:uncharacterized protein LOC114374968 [Glycine soja]KHN30201.1 hypothetical protein glysoja_010579 [Glycine soja]RZB84151.1 hypothetical protein D0Y65_032526 [Glycine soja]